MDHKGALEDFRILHRISGGYPHDAGELLESIAEKLMRRPTKAVAKDCLNQLISGYFVRGDANGDSLADSPEARKVFIRHGLMGEDGHELL